MTWLGIGNVNGLLARYRRATPGGGVAGLGMDV